MGKKMRGLAMLSGALLLVVTSGASAQVHGSRVERGKPQGFMVQSGTGFFVTSDGYIVTNEHVVRGCSQVSIRGGVTETTAKVVAVDAKNDLALLRSQARPRQIANIRHPDISRLQVGEPVMVMGYPGESSQTGQYKVAVAKVTGLKGPTDEPHWIQFSDAAQQGNSGGPLLDGSGNVAGVVVGKSELFERQGKYGRERLVSRSDLAISLPVLMKFLDSNYVVYRFTGSQGYMMPQRVEESARTYIVNIRCPRPDIPVS